MHTVLLNCALVCLFPSPRSQNTWPAFTRRPFCLLYHPSLHFHPSIFIQPHTLSAFPPDLAYGKIPTLCFCSTGSEISEIRRSYEIGPDSDPTEIDTRRARHCDCRKHTPKPGSQSAGILGPKRKCTLYVYCVLSRTRAPKAAEPQTGSQSSKQHKQAKKIQKGTQNLASNFSSFAIELCSALSPDLPRSSPSRLPKPSVCLFTGFLDFVTEGRSNSQSFSLPTSWIDPQSASTTAQLLTLY